MGLEICNFDRLDSWITVSVCNWFAKDPLADPSARRAHEATAAGFGATIL